VVIGGELLGLEAAKAVLDLGLETRVVEFAPRLMPRQLDDRGSQILVQKIEQLGMRVHLQKSTTRVLRDGAVTGLQFQDETRLDVEMVVVSAGIRPRDELARAYELDLGPRGGVMVNDRLRCSDEHIYAIGEVALHRGLIYGLVAPGYDMAETLAVNLTGGNRDFVGADLSTKLKWMGVDVASFGQYEGDADVCKSLTFEDPIAGIYKKLLVTSDGRQLLGGMLVGDVADYPRLLSLVRNRSVLPGPAHELILGTSTAAGPAALPDDAQVCSCHNVTKAALCEAVNGGAVSLGALKACTKAGTGCGGCVPLVTELLQAELTRAGQAVDRSLCEHFPFTRQELFQIAKINGSRSFLDLRDSHGRGDGCEICKPAIASILASLWNEPVLGRGRDTLQDTNDRFLANIQRGGLYSIVPRVPGGEITPQKLIALGAIAQKYGLYTKITGGQRVDLFGSGTVCKLRP
jgi:NAD(P)H-dependent nitrite reductase large subunit